MFPHRLLVRTILVIASVVLLLPMAQAQKRTVFASSDDTFRALRDAARRDDAALASALAANLGNYAIPSYVDYFQLKPRIRDASASEIQAFLARYDGSAIADRLRNDWLLELGRRRDWVNFDAQYPQFQLNDDTQVKCYALMSKAYKGINVAAEAHELLSAPKDNGDACIALMATLVQTNQFDAEDLWLQIRIAAETGSTDYMRRLLPLTGPDDDSLLNAMDKPGLIVGSADFSRIRREVFIVALGRAAKSNPVQAAYALTNALPLLTPKQQAQGWAQIALQASRALAPQAVDYWRKADSVPLSSEGYQWRVRAALRAGDWQLVKRSIDAMPQVLRDDPTWVYWKARALRDEGRREDAAAMMQSIVSTTTFYGQLALEDLGQKIAVPAFPAPSSEVEVAAMADNAGFRRALKFFDLDMRFEGYREWNWEVRRMNERQLLAAAEFARRSGLLDRMVNTSDRTRIEVDFNQRFPAPYLDIMRSTTQKVGLEMAWVYGLIRQESRFVMGARSQVGASGLMQLMPGTARHVAKKIGMTDFDQGRLNEVGTNILLGVNYMSMTLNDLSGSQTMATAAYNAGPSRARAWRSTLVRPVEGAIFAETIPFSETRDYVKKVLSNATCYAALFESRPQSLKIRLGSIGPAAFIPSELP